MAFSRYAKDLLNLSLLNMTYSHVLLIPFISGFFVFVDRKKVFQNIQYDFVRGTGIIVIGFVIYFIGKKFGSSLNQNDHLSIMSFSFVLAWVGGFALLYGFKSITNAPFPFLFLIFMVPVPEFILDLFIFFLIRGSAEVTFLLLKAANIDFVRENFTFYFPGLTIEVAEECSGIRSSIGLFITSAIAAHLFLKTGWKKAVLILSIFPITIFKNGLRITTLSLLGAFVDRRILSSNLHREGGRPFFALALILLIVILILLIRSEKKTRKV